MSEARRYAIPFIRPVFPSADELAGDFRDIVSANWFTNFGPLEHRFRQRVAAYVSSDVEAVTFNNATTALIAALHVILGQGEGRRQVIVPSFTFAAGPLSVEWAGYRPLFIDIDVDTLQPSLDEARRAAAGHDVAGILLCNTFGIGNPRIAEWERFASDAGLPLIIDSAAGFGSRYDAERRVGDAGTCEIFSFHATKPFAIGEGGAVITRDPEHAARLREFTNFGFRNGRGAAELGMNGKLQELNAAIGLRQLDRYGRGLVSRQQLLSRYRTKLQPGVGFPTGIELSSVCFATMLLPSKEMRERVRLALERVGVEARTYYWPPVHQQAHFQAAARVDDLTRSERIADTILSVPVYEDMEPESEDLIVETIANTLERG